MSEVRGAAERRYPASEVRGCKERSYPVSEVRGHGLEVLISSASFRSIQFLSFIEPIFA